MSDIIKISMGDSKKIPILIRDKYNSLLPLSLTGTDVRVYFTVKERVTDADNKIVIEKSNVGGGIEIDEDPSTGIVHLELTPADTALSPMQYVYDVRVYIDGEVFSQEPELFEILSTVKREMIT